MMIKRDKSGRLKIDSLDIEIFLGRMFDICNNEQEAKWLLKQMQSTIDCIYAERICEIKYEDYNKLRSVKMNKEFTKNDLNTGNIVKFRNGELGVLINVENVNLCKRCF